MAKQIVHEVKEVKSIKNMLNMAVKEAGDSLAYRYKGEGNDIVDVTFKQFYDDIENLGAALTERGFGNSHIACVGNNSYRWIVTYLTVLKSAGVYVPVDCELPTPEMLHVLLNSDAEVIFYSEKLENWMHEHREELPSV